MSCYVAIKLEMFSKINVYKLTERFRPYTTDIHTQKKC